MYFNIEKSWYCKLYNELSKPYFKNLLSFIDSERKLKKVYPSPENVFSCFNFTSFYDVRVVIVGQDPYCNAGQATGLAFSVPTGVGLPISLLNIYRELYNDLGIYPSKNGDLINWSKQGILMLNCVLTVEDGKPGSHFNFGWEFFTNFVIKLLSDSNRSILFVLLGKIALDKADFIDFDNNLVIFAAHPSPMSAYKGFFGSRLFSKINFNLKILMRKEINWKVD